MNNKRQERVFAFLDSQNINLGVNKDIVNKRTGETIHKGWPLDFKKLRIYLTNKYGVTEAYLFIGNIPGNEARYTQLQNWGYKVVLKPTIPYREDGARKSKGNVDAELVLYASALLYKKYDKAIIMSGDGDFLCLAEYLDAEDKLLRIMVPNPRYSSLLNRYAPKIVVLGKMRGQLGYMPPNQKTGLGGRSKP